MKEKLTVRGIEAKKTPGRFSDGGGLYLKVTPALTKSWIFRYKERVALKSIYMGIGSYPDIGLKEARVIATKQRNLLLEGIDPIAERKRVKALRKKGAIPTFDECSKQYIDIHSPEWSNAKHIQQWTNTLATYASPTIGELPINEVTREHILTILEPIWLVKTETATRVRQRIETIIGYATVKDWYKFNNPAMWRHNLDKLLPSAEKIKNVKHHTSLPYKQMAAFSSNLSEFECVSSSCLMFTILTACRTNESIGTLWEEIDLEDKLWVIPAHRMKARREHIIPLTPLSMSILKAQIGADDIHVFPGLKKDEHLCDGAMMKIIKIMKVDATVHGFRATFRTWAAEKTNYQGEICETSLAHVNTNKTEAAYLRSDHFKKRVKLMKEWEKFCNFKFANSNVVTLKIVNG